jgi:hypothetical protein
MTALEHQEIKGVTLKLIWVTISGVVSIVAIVCASYFGLKSDIRSLGTRQDGQDRVNDLRLTHIETEQKIQRQEIDDLKKERAKQ